MPNPSLPPEVLAVFDCFRTVEFTTIAKDGTPITWPVTALYEADSGTFVTATSIGLPNKAFHIRRNPRVALLFSEPKASGLTSPPAVLVQGEAQVDERVTTLAGLEALWEKIYRFQPAAQMTSRFAPGRYLMDWYYMRLRIRTVPRRIVWWPNGDFSRAPEVAADVG